MIHSIRFTCVLDTNVMYPLWTRDLLLWFAYFDLYTPKWSNNIFEEWLQVMIRKGVSREEALKRTHKANLAFPDALVKDYEFLIESLSLPDPKDRHVLAAAIKTNANLIVTNNLKDFPADYLARFSLSAKCPDDFFADIIDLNHHLAVRALQKLVQNKKRPPYSISEVLQIFRNSGLNNTADYFHILIQETYP